MMRILRRGEGYALSRPVKTIINYIPIYRKQGVETLLICLFSFHFVCFAQESRESGATEVGGVKRSYDFTLFDAAEIWPITRIRQIEREIRRYPKVDFNKFPMEMFKLDRDKIPKIQIGDRLPDVVLDMPLRVVNDEFARDTLTLRDCMDRTWIILDIWTEWCAPCLGSMDKWEELSKTDTSFTLLGLYSSHDMHRAMPEARKRGYLSSQVIGPAATILSVVFMHDRKELGPSIWIKNGRFFGVSEANTLREEDYRLLLDGMLDAIPEYAVWKPIAN